jgi:hypothetical protein
LIRANYICELETVMLAQLDSPVTHVDFLNFSSPARNKASTVPMETEMRITLSSGVSSRLMECYASQNLCGPCGCKRCAWHRCAEVCTALGAMLCS